MTTQSEKLNVQVRQIEEGRWHAHRSRYGDVKRMRVGKAYAVSLDGEEIGTVRFDLITRERSGKGKRYVYARWQSPGWTYHGPNAHRGLEAFGKQDAIDRLVAYALRHRRETGR